MQKLQPHKVGLAVGTFVAGVHLIWVTLILLGLAQPFLDFVFWLHMVTRPVMVTGFTAAQAVLLILVAFGIGNFFGWFFASIWNYYLKK